MKTIRYVVGAIGLLLVWFVVAVLVGLIVAVIFPPANRGTTRLGIVFDWRNLPGVILGLLAGIQSFRASVRNPQNKDEDASQKQSSNLLFFVWLDLDKVSFGGVLCVYVLCFDIHWRLGDYWPAF